MLRFYFEVALLSASLVFGQQVLNREATPCTCTEWSQISSAVASCTDITLSNVYAPAKSAMILSPLQTGATVTFAGTTTFGFTNTSSFRPIQIKGSNVTIQGAPGSIIDGGGPQYWDGLGDAGLPKPAQFLKATLTNYSTIKDLYIMNYPNHGLNLAGMLDSQVHNITVNNSAGDAPNSISNGKAAAHNTDGFNVGNCINLKIDNVRVWNQDDCVVISDSSNVTVSNAFCSGSHGLSITGGGMGTGHDTTNVAFSDSTVTKSSNGLRIKTDLNATGIVSNVTYSNIYLSDITSYGIDIQQNYPGHDPPSNGVEVSHITFSNVTGTVLSTAMDYYILCGDGSCSDFVYDGVNVTGSAKASSCNYPSTGCPT